MTNVRKSIAKKTLTATKAQAEALSEKQNPESVKVLKPKKVSKPSTAKKSLKNKVVKPVAKKKAAPKKVSVKGKTTAKIKQDLKEQSTLHPLGGMIGEALIKHHQARVQFLRENPDQNKSIHPNESWKQSRIRRGLKLPVQTRAA